MKKLNSGFWKMNMSHLKDDYLAPKFTRVLSACRVEPLDKPHAHRLPRPMFLHNINYDKFEMQLGNTLTADCIDKIMGVFDRKGNIAHFARSVPFEEIAANDYNLSVSSYVEAKKEAANKLHFDLDLSSHYGIDFEVDVDFDLVVACENNKISLKAESVKGQADLPFISSILDFFGSSLLKMDMGNFAFGNANVPFCPTIKVTEAGDISLRL